jgi:XTP/dITP diphosphohydrolase
MSSYSDSSGSSFASSSSASSASSASSSSSSSSSELKHYGKLLVATHNKGKLKEILRIFSVAIPNLQLFTLADFPGADEVDEVGETFEANALLKARSGFLHSGIPTLADDSGLVIDALDGRPGIHSARYSGGGDLANIEKVLDELRGVPAERRTARFVTVAAFVDRVEQTDREVTSSQSTEPTRSSALIERGELEGSITKEPQGEGGFGYDPIFAPAGSIVTLAQLTAEEKDEISHRGRALRKIAPGVGLRFAQIQRRVE